MFIEITFRKILSPSGATHGFLFPESRITRRTRRARKEEGSEGFDGFCDEQSEQARNNKNLLKSQWTTRLSSIENGSEMWKRFTGDKSTTYEHGGFIVRRFFLKRKGHEEGNLLKSQRDDRFIAVMFRKETKPQRGDTRSLLDKKNPPL